MARRVALVAAAGLVCLACGGGRSLAARGEFQAQSRVAPDRSVIRTGDLAVTVQAPDSAARAAETLVRELGGYVERSTRTDRTVTTQFRVPAGQLDQVMDRMAALGRPTRRSVSATDVTEERADLETRLATNLALRDRLRQLLNRANSVSDVLAIERELSRVQADIEVMQGRLDRLKARVEFALLTVTFERQRVLGPLGYVAYGIGWVLAKLFVIR